ncbi:MAG: FG-GAP-like repeat-containing protein [Terriglobales bacterium]
MKTFRLVTSFVGFLLLTLTWVAAQTTHTRADAGAPKGSRPESVKPEVSSTLVPTFATAVEYDSGGLEANNVVMADVNRDGIPDMIVCNTNGYSVFLGNGDGTFTLNNTYTPAGTGANFLAVADLTGNGFLDIVATTNYNANGTGGGLDVLMGNGDGTFQQPVSYNAGGFESFAIAIGDVNGDGIPDVVITSRCQLETCLDGNIILLLGRGKAPLFEVPYTIVAADNGGPVALADMNGDGYLDIVASGGILLGDGTNNFTPVNTTPNIPGGAVSITVADVNGDGKPDVAVATDLGAYLLLGNGDGTLQPPNYYSKTGGKWPLSVAVADINHDGFPDMLVANECQFIVETGGRLKECSNIGTVGAMTGNDDGTFNTVAGYALGYGFLSGGQYTTSVAVADVNGDGKPDLIVTNSCYSATQCTQGGDGGVSVLINTTHAATTTTLSSAPNPSNIYQSVLLTSTTTSVTAMGSGDTVTFYDGPTALGTSTTTNGVATFPTSWTSAGTHQLKATYAGGVWTAPSSSAMVKQVVNLFPSTTTITASPNPSNFEQPVTMVAKVSSAEAGGPTGTVTFKNGATSLGTETLSAGQAILVRSNLPVGTLTITATYNGDSQSAKSTGSTIQNVN